MSIEDTLHRRMHYVVLSDSTGNGIHLYWSHARQTLCGRNKIDRPRVIWGAVDCDECLMRVGEIALEAARKQPV